MRNRVAAYYQLSKPGIVYGNALPTIATFLFAANRHVDVGLFLAVLLGQSFIIASGCVFNNYIDRGIDKQMKRTKDRALVTGAIRSSHALVFASGMGLLGCGLLGYFVNLLTLAIGITGLIIYVVLYGITKRHGSYGTIVGSLSGALPPVAGYTAVTNRLDHTALLFFLILVFWQMPHFYAIALRRKDEYRAAHIPVLSVRKTNDVTKLRILYYIVAFAAVAVSLSIYSGAGWVYEAVALITSALWLLKGVRGLSTLDDTTWAKQMFLFSLIVLTYLCAAIALTPWLP